LPPSLSSLKRRGKDDAKILQCKTREKKTFIKTFLRKMTLQKKEMKNIDAKK